MVLHIDTKDQKKVLVSLKNGGEVIRELSEENEYGSQVLLPLIEKLLKSAKLTIQAKQTSIVEKGKSQNLSLADSLLPIPSIQVTKCSKEYLEQFACYCHVGIGLKQEGKREQTKDV